MHSTEIGFSHLDPQSATSLEESRQLIEILVGELNDMAEDLQRQEKLRKPIPIFFFMQHPRFGFPIFYKEVLLLLPFQEKTIRLSVCQIQKNLPLRLHLLLNKKWVKLH
jgi:hypothetical protein